MNVALAADRRRVSERSATAQWPARRSSWPAPANQSLELLECQGRQDGSGPGPEILGGEVGARDLAEIVVDVRGVDVLYAAFLVDVLEELLAGQLLAALDNPGEATVSDVDLVVNAALAAEFELDRGPSTSTCLSRMVVRPKE